MRKQFGGRLTKREIEKLAVSKNWNGDKFVNLEETKMDISFRTLPSLIKKQFTNRKERTPQQNLPVIPFNKSDFLAASESSKFIWYGHSVLLLRINNKTILIDPMFGNDTTPIAPFTTKRFSKNTLAIIDELPPIDLVLLSHDHYDHLDYASFEKLKSKTSQFFVALGTARHLKSWGIDENLITEFDWWDSAVFEDIKITFTPTRHFSGRGLKDRAKSLWGGWVFKTTNENIYFSGDSGDGNHFKIVGEKLGPFDIGFMECGQYNELWHQIHMYPEESIQAAIDAKVALAIPVHWGAFTLALHHWKDPIERFVAEAKKKETQIATPLLGELRELNKKYKEQNWWEAFR